MEAWLVLLLVALTLIFILPPIALFKAIRARREIESLKARLRALEERFTAPAPERIAEKIEIPPSVIGSVPPQRQNSGWKGKRPRH